MVKVKARFSFEDDRLGRIKANKEFNVSPACAKIYSEAGLLDYCKPQNVNPSLAPGKKLSASPVAPVLTPLIAKASKRGRKKKQAELL